MIDLRMMRPRPKVERHPRIEKRWELTHRPMLVELHVLGCDCPACEPYVPSLPPPRLDAIALGKLALAGVVVGHLIAALVWGPATVLHVLVANLTGARL